MLQRFHFHRFEFKYYVTPEQADQIYRELMFHMDPDPYAEGHEDKSYRVTSLYFDTDDLVHYYEKLDGIKTRKKFRIRTYETRPREGLLVYLEIKRRKGSVIIKDRADVPYEAIRHQSFGQLFSLLRQDHLPPQRKQTLEEFLFDLYRLRMTPQVLVTYLRKPLVARFNKKVRVTFDHELRSVATDRLFSSERGRFVFPSQRIMEVKFSGGLPWWLHHVIQKYELSHEPISKYCLAIDASERPDGMRKLTGYRRDYQWPKERMFQR